MLAVVGVEVGLLVAARAAVVPAFLLGLIYHGGGYDAGRYGDDGVAEYHNHAGDNLASHCDWGDVAISHGGEGDDCPIDAGKEVAELGAFGIALYHEHDGAEDDYEYGDKEEIDDEFVEASLDTLNEEVALVDEGEEFEHAEYSEQTNRTHDGEVLELWEEDAEELGNGSEEIDDSEETQHIVSLLGFAIHSEGILYGEEEGEEVLQDGEPELHPSLSGEST